MPRTPFSSWIACRREIVSPAPDEGSVSSFFFPFVSLLFLSLFWEHEVGVERRGDGVLSGVG